MSWRRFRGKSALRKIICREVRVEGMPFPSRAKPTLLIPTVQAIVVDVPSSSKVGPEWEGYGRVRKSSASPPSRNPLPNSPSPRCRIPAAKTTSNPFSASMRRRNSQGLERKSHLIVAAGCREVSAYLV